ncbi:MAG: helix-turn-helix transcriptional regulator [Lachnospiraceae bacterium]
MMFILSGEGEAIVNGIAYSLSRGVFLNLNPYHFYSMKIVKTMELYSISCSLSLPVAGTIQSTQKDNVSSYLYESAPVLRCNQERTDRIQPMFEQILQEIKNQEVFYRAITFHMFMELEEFFQRYSLMDSYETSKEEVVEWLAVKEVMLSTQQTLSLADMAKEYGISPQILNQKMRIATGYSFKQLVHLSRMINACSLLRFQDLSIVFIAKLFCYSSLNTFYREFKKYTNMTPEEYREQGGKKKFSVHMPNQGLALRILVYMHTYYREAIDSEQVAKEFYISESLLHKIMKNHFQLSFSELLMEIRIQYAAAMLCATKMPICDIAYAVGFESISTFNRSFKDKMKETASDYQQNMVSIEVCDVENRNDV